MTTTAIREKAPKTGKKASVDAAQRALVDAFRGSMPDLRPSVDEYLREKYAEIEAENAE